MPTWCFKAVASRTRESSALHWYWQIDPDHTLIAMTSNQLFASLEECIASARAHGFRGEVEMPRVLNDSSVITCDDGGHLHVMAQRARQARANRPRA